MKNGLKFCQSLNIEGFMMPQQTNDNMIVIAKVGAPYRLNGELKLYVLSDSIETALAYGQWFIKKTSDRAWQPLTGETVSRIGDKLIIQFTDANVKEIAAKYTNALIAVPRSVLKETAEDEYYWVDLIGMQVINHEGQTFGQVVDILETGANEVLCCKHQDKTYLIPFINEYVHEVNRGSKVITVDWQYDY
jgi:16S rRNA processing protein RimM